MPQTNVEEFLAELGAGVYLEKLGAVLSEGALAAVTHGGGKKAKITCEFTLVQVGDNDQVMVSHKLAQTLPTKRGKKSEEDTSETPMFVGRGGVMTVAPPEEEDSGQFTLDGEAGNRVSQFRQP